LRVPPDNRIVPLVMLSAALIVRLPPAPTCSVWLVLLMLIAFAAVAVPVNSSTDADAVAIVKAGPLLTAPDRFSVPPEAVIVPAPDKFAVTAPWPLKVAPLPIVIPDASLSVPPDNRMVPLVMLSAALIVRLPPVPTCSVWLALLIDI
jgi:hypothetical protein